MNTKKILNKILSPDFISFLVLINGLALVADNLYIVITRQPSSIASASITSYSTQINFAIGLLMIYLSTLIHRAKRTAWISGMLLYFGTLFFTVYRWYIHTSYRIVNVNGVQVARHSHHKWYSWLSQIIIPAIVTLLLAFSYKKFQTKSDSRSFKNATLISSIFIAVTFVYGVVGFNLMDNSAFHQEFSIYEAMHYTVDQLGITTSTSLVPYTNEGRIFLDSLNIASLGTILFVIFAFFSPIRSRFVKQEVERKQFKHLLENDKYASSEDFFKLWPEDKLYFIDKYGFSGLAYRVEKNVALVLGRPVGDPKYFSKLIKAFSEVCYGNDWVLSFFHFEEDLKKLLIKKDYSVQKIGEEAVVDVNKFIEHTISDKYFRNIVNRFSTNGYTSELFTPPHSKALVSRLQNISNDWLSRGRSERGFVMGYFTEEYINLCEVLVARDQAGTIQAFINLVPAPWDKEEVTYDMLRYSDSALGNVNDFIIIELIKNIKERNYLRLNLGLSPLANMDDDDDKGIVPRVMGLVYSNIDKMYSFSGLYRFKNKYSPEWRERYIAYKGGIRGFTKVMNALLKAMKKTAKPVSLKRSFRFKK